ncbi:MAG: hypothetical protein DRP67_05430 [Candidatus Omnitrophota bacterium]|nr:MAG: hypothetical protein DRP67_05430 [Candidatus Omnitrophota bacterium]
MNRKLKCLILFLCSILLFSISLNFLSRTKNIMESSLPEEKKLKKLPPEIAFTTILLGGFRGILTDFLWLRARKLQIEGKYFELVQLSNWIVLLEPNLPEVWRFNAWNLSYNISVEFPTPEERWNWIYQGIKLLRDKGLKYLPDSPGLYLELAWIYFDKISSSIDEFSPYYKRKWAKIMEEAFGDIKLDEMVEYSSYEKLMEDSEVKKIVKAFKDKGLDIFKNWEKISRDNFSSLPEELKVYLKNKSFRKIEAYMRGKILREKFKLIPEDMKEIEKKYLPLDWKAAPSHSLYWIEEGKKKTNMDEIDYERVVYFSLNHLFQWGKIDFKKVGEEEIMVISPYLEVADILNKYYEKFIERIGKEKARGIQSSQRTFLKNVILIAYTMNNLKIADKYFKYLKKHYPDEVGKLTLSGYIAKQYYKTIKRAIPREIFGLLYGILHQAFWYLGVGEEERYKGLESLAHLIYKHATSKNERFKRLFPTFSSLKRSILERAIDSYPPQISKVLKYRLLTKIKK